MIEYELEYLNWERRQLGLRQKYADTPPGLSAERAKAEEERQALAWKEYEKERSFCLTTGVEIPEEPFAGRREELAAIRRLFGSGIQTVFLSGMGGIGKSALARMYGRLYAGEYDHVLAWSYDKSLEQILADDGQLGISNLLYAQSRYHSRRRYAREKYGKLLQIAESERLLIILDNYNQLEDPWFEALLELPCDLLITTRLGRFLLEEKGYAILGVEGFSGDEDWKEFYRIYTGREAVGADWEAARAYRKSVLGHTLKMKLALCNPEQKWTAERFARSILSNFRLRKAEIQILCELSFLTPHGILEEAYLSCTEEMRESLDTLKSYSLVQQRTDSMGRLFLFLHPVIAEAVQTTWHPGLTRCLSFVEKFSFYARFTWYRPREGDFWLLPQVFALLKRLPKPVAWRYYLYENLATFLFAWEYFREAEEIMRPLYECVRSYYGEVHQVTAYMAMRVAVIYYDSMQLVKSRGWYKLSYELYEKAQPADHNFYMYKAVIGSRMARMYEYAGEYKAAQHCLDTAMNLFLMSEFQQVEIRRLQARLYFAEGEYEKVRDAATKDLEICVRYQGETYKISLVCRELLGDALQALGEAQAAQEEYIRVLRGLQKNYPHQTGWMERLRRKLGDMA